METNLSNAPVVPPAPRLKLYKKDYGTSACNVL
jgi:hypothetical protein